MHILPKFQTAPLISLGVLCDDGCTITLYKQEIPIQKNGKEIIKGTRKKKTGMWEVPLGTKQLETVVKKFCHKHPKKNYPSIYMQHFSAQLQKV